jgi:ligand-binding SRPBCC domain-containing protein
MYTLRKTILVPASLDRVFHFFNRPENLEKLTPAFLKFTIMTPPPVEMANGAVFDYRIRLLGCPLRWTSVINNYDPPHGFVDIQLRGPYAFWHHQHRFVPKQDGVEVVDEVHYDVGFSAVGRLMHALVVRRQLNMIFSHREKVIGELFPDVSAAAPS